LNARVTKSNHLHDRASHHVISFNEQTVTRRLRNVCSDGATGHDIDIGDVDWLVRV
jgi:hypothetical protein